MAKRILRTLEYRPDRVGEANSPITRAEMTLTGSVRFHPAEVALFENVSGVFDATHTRFTLDSATSFRQIDSVPARAGMVVLLLGQDSTPENGPYVIFSLRGDGAVSTFMRCFDANSASDFVPGREIYVWGPGESGGVLYRLTAPVEVLGEDSIVFAKVNSDRAPLEESEVPQEPFEEVP